MTKPNPQNPKKLPREVYTRRRVAALIIVLTVVALLVWAVSAMFGGGSDSTESAAVTSVQTTSSEAETTSETSSEASSEVESSQSSETAETSQAAEDSAEPSTPLPADAKQSCELSDLQITATVAEDTFAPDALPVFYMKVHNPTAADCVINLEENQLRFEVYSLSTNARMWADTDCYPAVETGEQVFKSNEDRNFKAEWSRRTSKPGQCSERLPAPTGSYYVHAVVGDNPSAPTPFNLA